MKKCKTNILIMCILFCVTLFVGCENADPQLLTLEQLRKKSDNVEDLVLRAMESDIICVIKSEQIVSGKNRLKEFYENVKNGVADFIEIADLNEGEHVCNQNYCEITKKYYPKNEGKFKANNHSAEIVNKDGLTETEVNELLLKHLNAHLSYFGDEKQEPNMFLYVCRIDFDGEKITFSNNIIKYDLQQDVYIGDKNTSVKSFAFEETNTDLYLETYSAQTEETTVGFGNYICWLFKDNNGEVVKSIDWFE